LLKVLKLSLIIIEHSLMMLLGYHMISITIKDLINLKVYLVLIIFQEILLSSDQVLALLYQSLEIFLFKGLLSELVVY